MKKALIEDYSVHEGDFVGGCTLNEVSSNLKTHFTQSKSFALLII